MATTLPSALIRHAEAVARSQPGVYWYALVDAAQHSQLPQAVGDEANSHSLFGAAWETPLGRKSPWLVHLEEPVQGAIAWLWLERTAPRLPSIASVIASRLPPNEQLAHLQCFLDLKLPDGDEMVLAFWDPAILGSLIGQVDDGTLHVKGPILEPEQRSALLGGMLAWWYWDRSGTLQAVDIAGTSDGVASNVEGPSEVLPLTFSQAQVDMLVEASVPDQVLYHLRLNQPLLLEPLPPEEQYPTVQGLVQLARAHGLETFRDLCNFSCAGLIYGERMTQDSIIIGLLARLKSRQATWDELVTEFPE